MKNQLYARTAIAVCLLPAFAFCSDKPVQLETVPAGAQVELNGAAMLYNTVLNQDD